MPSVAEVFFLRQTCGGLLRVVFGSETDLVSERGPVSLVCQVGFIRVTRVWTPTVFEITNVRFEIAEWTKKTVANSSARG